jgi:D-alanyl-D-alanine carboxypeptidase (penicillin-binding protein 5/6)
MNIDFKKYGLLFSLLASVNLMPCVLADILRSPLPVLENNFVVPKVDAKAYVLVDQASHQILVENGAHQRLEPASLTKMLTVYITEQEIRKGRLKLEDEVTVSEHAWKATGSRMFIQVGTKVKVGDLLKGAIIQSGNDASIALAEAVAGSEEAFAGLMNQTAQEIGMVNSHFVNATGLPDPNHYTTPYDMALLSSRIIEDTPETYPLYSEKWFTYNGIKQPNRNRLLWQDNTVDGIKTGHTDNAGYCLVASAKRNNMRLIAVVMGTPSENARAEQTQKLLAHGFRFYESHKVYDANKPLEEQRVWMGEKETVGLGLKSPLFIAIPSGRYDQLSASVTLRDLLTAPTTEGKIYGKVTIKLDDKVVAEEDLIALETIEEGSIWQRVKDYVALSYYKMFPSDEANEQDEDA